MSRLLRLFIVSGLIAFAIIATALELIHHGVNLLAPGNLFLFAVGMAFYLLPTALALYRKCEKTVWIAVVNVLLGWTIAGWVMSLGSAANGEVSMLRPAVVGPSRHAFLRH